MAIHPPEGLGLELTLMASIKGQTIYNDHQPWKILPIPISNFYSD